MKAPLPFSRETGPPSLSEARRGVYPRTTSGENTVLRTGTRPQPVASVLAGPWERPFEGPDFPMPLVDEPRGG